eukprot:Skav209260  [mRNA]  locus=scaffold1552:1958:9649:+ [translate_table: standard]
MTSWCTMVYHLWFYFLLQDAHKFGLGARSDGGASAADRSERTPSRRNQRKKRGTSAESADAGTSTAARTADASEAPDSALEDLSESYQADVLRSGSDTEASVRGRKSTSRSGGVKVARPKVRPAGAMTGHAFQAPFGNDFYLRGLFGGEPDKSFSDLEIIKALAAPPEKHQRLLDTAKRLPEILLANDPPLANSAELYGSLALMRAERGEEKIFEEKKGGEVRGEEMRGEERRAERGEEKILQEKKGGEVRGEERRGEVRRAERGEEKIRQEKKEGEMRGEERRGEVRRREERRRREGRGEERRGEERRHVARAGGLGKEKKSMRGEERRGVVRRGGIWQEQGDWGRRRRV